MIFWDLFVEGERHVRIRARRPEIFAEGERHARIRARRPEKARRPGFSEQNALEYIEMLLIKTLSNYTKKCLKHPYRQWYTQI